MFLPLIRPRDQIQDSIEENLVINSDLLYFLPLFIVELGLCK